ncbi:diphthine--ammonia ligase [Nilaparvata lugens]|uniref:diphthine--ammonia ligase n=1 Tax=Nilaparvata lugens TaxID=108931 RepID=UPI00193DF8AB|nr:diphthine--ammonia ligase [Nilaparvata lugens]
MKVVALISGGKDSCYNMLQCVAAGHQVVALANLRPESKDELDSYMYQTVGHQGIELYAEALGLPLFRQSTHGVALHHDKVYLPTPEDEVEDLYRLLVNVKDEIDIEAVAVGAVLSDYQRIRVENVCSRLGLVALAYLWRRDQAELLQEMIDCSVEAVIIKVAALGLDPSKHLGKKISEIQPHLVKMNEKYGLNICGEGGEYETFTLDMPLFAKSLIIEEFETVIHSNDAIAPVGYLNFGKMRLVEKENTSHELSLHERLIRSGCPVRNAIDYISDIDVVEDVIDSEDADQTDDASQPALPVLTPDDTYHKPEIGEEEQEDLSTDASVVVSSPSGWTWLGGIVGDNQDIAVATKTALSNLCGLLETAQVPVADLVSVCLYVRDMSAYAHINSEYVRVLSALNPPVRVCVETPLSPNTPVVVEALAYTPAVKKPRAQGGETPTDGGGGGSVPMYATCARHTMHVQGVSHWAPANIGPYSQSVRIGDMILVAGQIALVPGSMQMVDGGGVRRQCRLSLRHVGRIIRAMDANTQLRDVVQVPQSVTVIHLFIYYHSNKLSHVEQITKRFQIVIVFLFHFLTTFILIPLLFVISDEETGFVVGCNRVSLCRRWNYDNTISAIVVSVSAGRSVSSLTVNEGDGTSLVETIQPMSEEQLVQVFSYSLNRLTRNATDVASLVCVLRIFYRADRSPKAETIMAALGQVEGGFKMVPTLVPVVQLGHPNTFLSICAVRHV